MLFLNFEKWTVTQAFFADQMPDAQHVNIGFRYTSDAVRQLEDTLVELARFVVRRQSIDGD